MAENPTGSAGGLSIPGGQGSDDVAIGRVGQRPQGAGGVAAGGSLPGPTERRTSRGAETSGGDQGDDVSDVVTEPALGAGGTSYAGEDGEDDQPDALSPNGGSAAKVAGAAAAVPVANTAAQLMVIASFLNWLKGMMMTLMALGANLWNLAVALLLAGGKAVAGFVMGIGAWGSSMVGGAISAAAAGTATVTAMVVGGAVLVSTVVTGVTSGTALAMKDSGPVSCQVIAERALEAVDGGSGSVDAKTLENAKTVYSVLSAWGMPDENIAGIIGNWDAESGVDPTSVQSYFDSPQVMSDAKKSAATNTDNGIGLGQWTFGRNANLRTYADSHGKDWWTLEMQLGFMVSAAEGSDAGVVKDMMVTSYGTPTEAALHFHDKWERSADTASMAARRGEKATKWMGMFSGWSKNQALADSILAQAGTTVEGANGTRAETVSSDCVSTKGSDLAMGEGGLNLEQATELMALYRTEGEGFLQSRYGAGGPGDCGYGKADNCVGFTTYFVNKYTSFQQYAMGNGIDTAGSMARMTGKTLSQTPTVYSVASGPGSGSAGHTFVVLGIEGDQAVIGEAACGTNHRGTQARLMPLSQLTSGVWEFVDMSDLITDQPAES